MRLLLVHGYAPEVIEKNVDERSGGLNVLVISDCTSVIKHKSTSKRVDIADDAGRTNNQY